MLRMAAIYLDEQVGDATGGVAAARGAVQQADAPVREVQARVEPARKRIEQNRELVKNGAGDRHAHRSQPLAAPGSSFQGCVCPYPWLHGGCMSTKRSRE